MNIPRKSFRRTTTGYALIMVLIFSAVSLLILSATLNRTATVAKLNDQNAEYNACMYAAEGAVEKAYTMMAYDFVAYGPGLVAARLSTYSAAIPSGADDTNYSNFNFIDPSTGNAGTYVGLQSSYSGSLPQSYSASTATCVGSPIYRIVSNVTSKRNGAKAAVQIDVLLALVPLNTYAIFYNGLLEFSTCAPMTVNGRVHANGPIFVGAGSSGNLVFNDVVSAQTTLSAPTNNGSSWGSGTNYITANSGWKTTFNGTVTNSSNGSTNTGGYLTNVSSVSIAVPMTNTHSLIEMPTPGESLATTNTIAQQRLYNQAMTVLLVSNNTVTLTIQKSPSAGALPATDAGKIVLNYTNLSTISSNLPFLTLTNQFYDKREDKTNVVTQIDVGRFASWAATNASVLNRFPTGGSTTNYPTIMYVADNRTGNANLMSTVRLTNGLTLPSNGGRGWSVATPNPLYVWGHYNDSTGNLGTTNTSATVPAGLMSDALTILSPNWKDAQSWPTNAYTLRQATNTTVNAAILTGIVPSTDRTSSGFSGGVHNLPRLLEDWNSPSSKTLTINTSIINLYNSTIATGQFVNPGTYYDPPTRQFSYDPNFLDANKQPPGIPCALVPLRYNWYAPPSGSYTNNVVP